MPTYQPFTLLYSPLLVVFSCLFLQKNCTQPTKTTPTSTQSVKDTKISGLTLVAPPAPFESSPMPAVVDVHANYIAVVPYAFSPKNRPIVRYDVQGKQWWGELPEGVLETVRLAHASGVEVMLKPQVYVPGGWTGDLVYASDTENAAWEADYRRYILLMAALADSAEVGMFCIGTEFRKHVAARPAFWHQLIREVRQIYRGRLTYSANWDDYEHVPFWGDLDFVGISAYFPLVNAKTPTENALRDAWSPIVERLHTFHKKTEKPILFTEFGYLSTDYCAWRTWEIEPKVEQMPINQEAQARAIGTLLGVFSEKNWWAGGFLWKWFPHGQGHEGYPERDYCPQGKAAENVLRVRWGGGKPAPLATPSGG